MYAIGKIESHGKMFNANYLLLSGMWRRRYWKGSFKHVTMNALKA